MYIPACLGPARVAMQAFKYGMRARDLTVVNGYYHFEQYNMPEPIDKNTCTMLLEADGTILLVTINNVKREGDSNPQYSSH